MQLEVGAILEGKVTGITKFGAFVELEGGKTGMVHISEIAPTFVKEIRDFVTEGQMVKVKILSIGEDGKISLSIKRAKEPSAAAPEKPRTQRPSAPKPPLTFEEKLRQFMSDSDSRISGSRQYEHKTKTRKR